MEGQSLKSVAASLRVHPGSVSRWLTRWRRNGQEGLAHRKATGRPRIFDCEQHGEQVLRIVRRLATEFGFENPLWTCRRLRDVIVRELGIKLSIPTMWRLLRERNLTCQKPERRAVEQDPVARELWLREEWPAIKTLAREERALIFFEDEACVRLTPTLGRTWGPVGKRPKIPVTGKRASICVMSAVSPQGNLFFTIPEERVNSDIYISFLRDLLSEYPRRKLFVIADQASPHTSKKTKFFAGKKKRLRLFYLPAYSPDFNPDEQVWNHLKNQEMKAHAATDKESLRSTTSRAMRRMGVRPSLVRSFFHRSEIKEHFQDLL